MQNYLNNSEDREDLYSQNEVKVMIIISQLVHGTFFLLCKYLIIFIKLQEFITV